MLATSLEATACTDRAPGARATKTTRSTGLIEERMASAATRRLEPKEHLFLEGDAKSHIYKVEAGTLLIYKILPDAKRQIVDIAFPGDLIGLGAGGEHNFSAQATEPSRVRCLPASSLHQMAIADPGLALRLYEALSLELEAARSHMLTIGYRQASERVATFLLALSRRNRRQGQDASKLVLPMRRSDIADFLGLTIETVSRTFTRLKSDGVIEIDQGGYVEIMDAAALSALAEGTC